MVKKEAVRPRSPTPLFSVRAVYDFAGGDEGELRLTRGDIVDVYDDSTFKGIGLVHSNTKDWWKGSKGGKVGIFPQNYVEKVQGRRGNEPASIENAGPLVDKFLHLLATIDPRRSISEQGELQDTYQEILVLQPKILAERRELEERVERIGAVNERFMRACGVYQRLMEEGMQAQRDKRGELLGVDWFSVAATASATICTAASAIRSATCSICAATSAWRSVSATVRSSAIRSTTDPTV
jgi:signal transducing adaptor molecule